MQFNIWKVASVSAVGAVMAFGLSACETPGQTALLGAGAGAAIGANGHGGALRGAAIGAGAGYVAGRVVQSERERAYEQGLADRGGYYYDDARYYRGGRYYGVDRRPIVRERSYYVAPGYRTAYAY